MPNNCNTFNIDGATVRNLVLLDPTISGGVMSGTVIAKDCDNIDITAGSALVTCQNLAAVEDLLQAEIDQTKTELQAEIGKKQHQLLRPDGTPLPADVCIMSCDETRQAISDAIADVCGLQDMKDCQDQPICSGANIATCRDLADATDGVLRNVRDCEGNAIPDGAQLVTCMEFAAAKTAYVGCNGQPLPNNATLATCADLDDVAVNLTDCRGEAIPKGAAVALCSDLDGKQDQLADKDGNDLPADTCVVTCSQYNPLVVDDGDTYITNNGRGVRYVRTNDVGQTQKDAHAKAVFSTAVGYEATAASDAAIAIGRNAQGAGIWGVAIGKDATAGTVGATGGRGSVAIGETASAYALNATAVGATSSASGIAATAIGLGAQATGRNSTALGGPSIASHDGSVAVGNGTQTVAPVRVKDYTVAGVTYSFAGAGTDESPLPSSVVSIGVPSFTRQLVNVAPGQIAAASTDAVNGSQLFALVQAIEAAGGGDPHFDPTTAPAIVEDGALSTNVYGAQTATMGAPAGWFDVVVAGVTHKVPYY